MAAIIRVRVSPRQPDPAALQRAVTVILSGGVVVAPTDTLYALAADPSSEAAVARVFAIKGRAADQALPLIAADLDQVRRWFGDLPPMATRLAAAFWPGPLTMLMSAPPRVAGAVHAGTGKVGVRVPAHDVARALCALCDRPLTATSANVSGMPATMSVDEVTTALGQRVDLVLDSGATAGGPPSTIIDVSGRGAEPKLIRAGVLPWDEIVARARA